MELQYRVFGKVNKAFILRGMHFGYGFNFDFCVTEEELQFVKERSDVKKIKDLQEKVSSKNPITLKVKKETLNNELQRTKKN